MKAPFIVIGMLLINLCGPAVANETVTPTSPTQTSPFLFTRKTSCYRPDFPTAAIEQGLAGSVTIRWHVGPLGEVLRVDIAQSSSSDLLDQAAVRAAKRCQFPVLQDANSTEIRKFSRTYQFTHNSKTSPP